MSDDATDEPGSQWPSKRVYTRADLRTGSWEEVRYLDVIEIVERVSPGVTTGQFVFRAGSRIAMDEDAFSDVSPLDLIGKFVRVDLLTPGDESTGEETGIPDPLKTFVLQFTGDEQNIGATLADDIAQPITQTLTAVGIEYALDQITVTGGYFYVGDDGPAAYFMPPIEFNEVGQVGLAKIGNRCAPGVNPSVPNLPPGAAARATYAFDAKPRADGALSDVWSTTEIIQYLFACYVLDFDISWNSGGTGGTGGSDPVFNALNATHPIRFSAEGLTIKQALDRLIRPEQGLGWFIRAGDDTNLNGPVDLLLQIYPVSDSAIALSETTLPANTFVTSLDASSDPDVIDCVVANDGAESYGEVLVLGEQVLSCFTVSQKDGTLEKDWTDAQEADYKRIADPTYTAGPAGDSALDLDNLQNVYCRYRLPFDWDGRAGDGKGGTKTLVNPKLATDGALTADDAHLNRMRRGFVDLLPLEEPDRDNDSEFKAAGVKQYRPAFLLLQYPPPSDATSTTSTAPARRFGYSERMPMAPTDAVYTLERGDVRMLPDRYSVHLQFHTPHVMANSEGWTQENAAFLPAPSAPATYAYQECVATVALRMEQRLFVKRAIPDATNNRRLIIEISEAELWLVAPGTVTGVDPQGALIAFSGIWPSACMRISQRLGPARPKLSISSAAQ